MNTHFGEYGGEVQRLFHGGGKERKPGDILSADEVADWPLANRKSLQNVGKVAWFAPPSEKEDKARGGKEAKTSENKVKPNSKKETGDKPGKTTRRRRNSKGGKK